MNLVGLHHITMITSDALHAKVTQFLTAGLADELHLVVAPLFVGDSRAQRFVGDGSFPWNPDRRAELAEVHRLGDVVLLRYALSDRFDKD